MPNEDETNMILTHELERTSSDMYNASIPIGDPNVREVEESEEVKILGPCSTLAASSARVCVEFGPMEAIRMQMLRVADIKGDRMTKMVQACYVVLVLVLPSEQDSHGAIRNSRL